MKKKKTKQLMTLEKQTIRMVFLSFGQFVRFWLKNQSTHFLRGFNVHYR